MTQDQLVFGPKQYVYCNQHLRPHLTGWCTVETKDKLGLGISDTEENARSKALSKCVRFGLTCLEDQ